MIDVTRAFKQGGQGHCRRVVLVEHGGVLLAGAALANKLGAELDIEAMYKFLTATFLNNRRIRGGEGTEGGTLNNTEQSLSKFLNFHAGSGHVVCTDITFTHKDYPVKHPALPRHEQADLRPRHPRRAEGYDLQAQVPGVSAGLSKFSPGR